MNCHPRIEFATPAKRQPTFRPYPRQILKLAFIWHLSPEETVRKVNAIEQAYGIAQPVIYQQVMAGMIFPLPPIVVPA